MFVLARVKCSIHNVVIVSQESSNDDKILACCTHFCRPSPQKQGTIGASCAVYCY